MDEYHAVVSVSHRFYQVAFLSIPSLGPQTYNKVKLFLREHHLSWAEWWTQTPPPVLTEKQTAAFVNFCQRFTPQSYLEYLTQREIGVLLQGEPDFPLLLEGLKDAPTLLYVHGGEFLADLLKQPTVGVVGTRRASLSGEETTMMAVRDFVSLGYVIVSGFMYGIDAVAHQTALESGGKSIAVLGYGMDFLSQQTVFSPEWVSKFRNDGNVIVTEYAPDTPPNKGLFAERNKIIAGLSQAIVVGEAGEQSGSFITVARAHEYHRPVFTFPYPITHDSTAGTLYLLQKGAKVVWSGREVVEHLPKTLRNESEVTSPLQSRIVQILFSQPATAEEFGKLLQCSTSELSIALTLLEMSQKIQFQGEAWSLNPREKNKMKMMLKPKKIT